MYRQANAQPCACWARGARRGSCRSYRRYVKCSPHGWHCTPIGSRTARCSSEREADDWIPQSRSEPYGTSAGCMACRSTQRRMRSGTHSRRICSRAAQTCVRSRTCWVMRVSPPLSATPQLLGLGCWRCGANRTPALDQCVISALGGPARVDGSRVGDLLPVSPREKLRGCSVGFEVWPATNGEEELHVMAVMSHRDD
jgi:hypothetical protein